MRVSKSTNAKLYEFIHSKNNDHEDEENLLEKEQRAKARLRRTALYGGGARIKIPKIKKKPSSENPSPYQIGTRDVRLDTLPDIQSFDNSIPPGAHTDQYRFVTDNTVQAVDDPDRIFYNSQTIKEGLQYQAQPPWYYGNQNNAKKPPDQHLLMAAGRYGYRGAQNIHQYSIEPYREPAKTRTKQTPDFLDNGDFIDEWVPPIVATVSQTVNGYESPKKWPVNTEFVTGYPHKQLPESSIYNRETTISSLYKPIPSDSLSKTMTGGISKDELLQAMSDQESCRTLKSLPIEAQQEFASTWENKVAKHANSSLRVAMNSEQKPHEKHTLMDPSDTMKYSGTTAMIVHTQTTDELKFRLRMQRSKNAASTPFHIRWNHICRIFQEITGRLKRKETMDYAIMNIGRELQTQAIKTGSETSINRVDFISTCGKNPHLKDASTKQLSILYSCFDPLKKNALRFVEFMATLKVLDNPSQDVLDKLRALWHVHHELGLDRNVFDICQDIMSTCCFSTEEVAAMELLFREEFRPACYKLALLYKEQKQRKASNSSVTSVESMENLNAATSDAGSSSGPSDNGSPDSLKGKPAPELATAKRSLSIVPQYNICESYLNVDTFIDVLQICPVLVSTFDEALSKRLIMVHGVDPRIKVELAENAMVQDFKWIFAKKADKIHQKQVLSSSKTHAPPSASDNKEQESSVRKPPPFNPLRDAPQTAFHQEIAPVKARQFSFNNSIELSSITAPTSNLRSPIPLPPLPGSPVKNPIPIKTF